METTKLLCALAFIGVGCTNPNRVEIANAELGIAELVTEETAHQTVVRGLDASGNEVARVELVHGLFSPSPAFADEFDTPEVDGRTLSVRVMGQGLHYETAGYEPVLQMPAHPPDQWAVAALLEEPAVKPVLDRWQLGFLPSGAETPYVMGTFHGHNAFNCGDGATTCGEANNGTQPNVINLCSGNKPAIHARRLLQLKDCDTLTNSWFRITQFCPAAGAQPDPWFAIKLCPIGQPNTACGNVTMPTQACKGCPNYPVSATGTLSSGALPNPPYAPHNGPGGGGAQHYSSYDYNLI